MREDQFTQEEINLLKMCLLQSISNNHKYAEDSLKNKLNEISALSYSSSQERIEKLEILRFDIEHVIDHLGKIDNLLKKCK